MKKIYGFILLIMFLVSLSVNYGCNKEKCGCDDGDILFTLKDEPGFIYYDEGTKYAYFTPRDIYGNFTLCNPVEKWDMITEFKSGEKVLISGPVADDCIKKTNPAMYSGYYVIHLDTLMLDEFGR